MDSLRIVALSMAAAICYGVLQDQVTARVCVEYFTIGHPPIFNTEDPTLLAIGWGILGTWWVGLFLGIPLALAAQLGSRPRLPARELALPLVLLMTIAGVISLLAGLTGYVAAQAGFVWLLEPVASRIPTDRHVVFLADLWAHLGAYLSGFVGAVVLWVRTWRRRARQPVNWPVGP